MNSQIFSIVPVASKVNYLILLPIFLLVMGLMIALLYAILSINQTSFEVTATDIKLNGFFYGRSIPRQELKTAQARIVNVKEDPQLSPKWRTNGLGLVGYSAGWFRLKSGEKALLFLSDPSRAVYIPTTNGYSLLLSPAQPEALLKSLQTP